MSEMLEKARKYEMEESMKITQDNRPVYHFSNPVGWMNIKGNITYSSSIILMQHIGILCIGDTQKVWILSSGNTFL